MNWFEIAENSQFIADLYTQAPKIEKIHLMEIHLYQEDSTMNIRADLPMFPDKLPADWKGHFYNEVQVHLKCIDMEAIEIIGWVGEIDVNFQLNLSEDKRWNLHIISRDCSIHAVFHRLVILSVNGYINASKGTL